MMRTQDSCIDPTDVRVFSGQSNPALAEGVAEQLGVTLAPTHYTRFSNDNLEIQLGASVRGRSVFVVQSLTQPVSEHLLELLMMLDIARSAAAREVHAVLPYFSYARSDKKNAPRISITARLIADLLETAGATHVMTMTLHSPQVHGFFRLPIDPLTARALFVRHFASQSTAADSTVVVAPDAGSAKSSARFADYLGFPTAVATKTRVSDTVVTIDPLVGRQVEGFRHAIIYDDEIATGGSVVELTQILTDSGVEDISVVCTHGLFLGNAIDRLGHIQSIREIVTTDTVPIPSGKRLSNMTVLSVAPVFAEAIKRNHRHESLGDLFTFGESEEDPSASPTLSFGYDAGAGDDRSSGPLGDHDPRDAPGGTSDPEQAERAAPSRGAG
jgi:ribose-phosphate pyrophosphokinase